MVNSAIPFLLLPVLTRYLSPADYGTLSLLQTMYAVVLPLVTFGITSGVVVFYHKMELIEYRLFLGNALLVSSGIAILITTSLGIYINVLGLRVYHLDTLSILVIPVWSLGQCIIGMVASLYRAREQQYRYSAVLIGNSLVNMAITLLLVVVYDMGWQGRYYGVIVSVAFVSAISIIILFVDAKIIFEIRRSTLKRIFRFGGPLMPHALGGVAMAMASRLIVQHYLGSADLGTYTVAFQLASLAIMIGSALAAAWNPFLFSRLSKDTHEANREIVLYTYYLLGVILIVCTGLYLAMPLVFTIAVDPVYWDGIPLARGLILGSGFNAVYYVYSGYFFYYENTRSLSVITVTAGLLSVFVNIIMIRQYGLNGVVAAYVLTWIVFAVAVIMVVRKTVQLPWLDTALSFIKKY